MLSFWTRQCNMTWARVFPYFSPNLAQRDSEKQLDVAMFQWVSAFGGGLVGRETTAGYTSIRHGMNRTMYHLRGVVEWSDKVGTRFRTSSSVLPCTYPCTGDNTCNGI